MQMPSEKKSSSGPMIGAIIVVIIILLGAFYFFRGARDRSQVIPPPPTTTPPITAEEITLPDASDVVLPPQLADETADLEQTIGETNQDLTDLENELSNLAGDIES